MASSFCSNSQHIDFDSVLAMDDQGMVSMFQALMASGLAGFLGCPAVIYEAALVDFFENASVREGVIISTVAGQLVEISEEWFAESFDLPAYGLGDLSEIPKDVIFDARSIVSLSGSFNAITVEKFSMLTAVVSLLLENIPNLELGESSEFPASKIISVKTVHRHVSLNDKVGAEDAVEAFKPKAASKKRPSADVGAPVEAVPIQMVEPITVAPAAEDLSDQPASKTDGEEAVDAEVDASADRDQTTVEVGEAAADKDFSLVDDPDTVINQVLNQLDSISDDKDDKQSDRAETWFDRASDEMLRNDCPVVTPSDTDEEEEIVDVGTAGRDQQMSLEDILMTTPVDVSLPSAVMEITKIRMGKEIKIPEVNERTWFLNSLPKIPADNKGKAILVEKDPVKGNPAKEHYFLICADIDLLVNLRARFVQLVTYSRYYRFSLFHCFGKNSFMPGKIALRLISAEASIARLDAQDRVLGALRRDSHDQRNLLSLELQSYHKQLGTQIVTTGLDVVDVRRVVRETHQELNARINSLDEQVAATQNDLLEFSSQAQQTLNIITSQLSELVAYINRGGDNKKGKSSSNRRPLPTPAHQSEGTGDAMRITEPTQAIIDNANRAILERMRNEDRERERRERSRGSRSGSYKRRRF
ncbi:hypothetical protein F511_31886 [Dorcoceras hygrometricum]|uniref:Dystroglycan-like n=1 Tax=Dorcoceras hygrometricum TaxID=472368 RepID=A0A2Z7DDF2_9LAMI|nr:hypothetical protein F511_31886 [Dorcoceras hygrometricum]